VYLHVAKVIGRYWLKFERCPAPHSISPTPFVEHPSLQSTDVAGGPHVARAGDTPSASVRAHGRCDGFDDHPTKGLSACLTHP
jgi:hypothetical protein